MKTVSNRAGSVWFFKWLLSLAACLHLIIPLTVFADPRQEIYAEWDEVSRLRSQGDFDRAVQVLADIIEGYSQANEIIRHAYNELVFTYLQMKDDDRVLETARQALERFPDIEAQPPRFPMRINETYTELRKQMFGSFSVTKPEGAEIFLDEAPVGVVPYEIELIRVGEYTLRLSKARHHDYVEVIQIQPSEKLIRDVSMDRQRDRRWWMYRIGAGLAAGTLVAFGFAKGGDAASDPEPLPGPPSPPSR